MMPHGLGLVLGTNKKSEENLALIILPERGFRLHQDLVLTVSCLSFCLSLEGQEDRY